MQPSVMPKPITDLPPVTLLNQAREVFNEVRRLQPELKPGCSAALILRRAAKIMSCGSITNYQGNNSNLLLAAMKEARS